ncbi:MAG: hypothetical protein KGM47_04270 [Acidobacteriota bacterium]|nr:hypothetical protein [Acidobacteriota bacterium]
MKEFTKPGGLPYGARGVEAAGVALVFGADKFIFLDGVGREHYTLHFGGISGVADLHRTWRDIEGVERHETLFALPHAHFPAILRELSGPLRDFPRLIRRLRVGWLARHRIWVLRGLEFATNGDIAAVTSSNRRKRLVVEEEKIRRNLKVPRYLDDVWEWPDGPFSLFSGNRRIGIAWKVTDKFGRPRLFWLKLRDLVRFGNQIGPQLIQTALRYAAIPPEKGTKSGVNPIHDYFGYPPK